MSTYYTDSPELSRKKETSGGSPVSSCGTSSLVRVMELRRDRSSMPAITSSPRVARSTPCPFCTLPFKRLECHLPKCKAQAGRDYTAYQDDPPSVLIFLTVMATLSDALAPFMDLGVVVPGSESHVNHLLYADDTCITAHTPAACQHLLDVVQHWLDWANLMVQPSKSRVLCIKASTGRVYMPPLSIGGEVIQHVGDSSFQFLGMHIRVPPNPATARDALKQSVVSMLKAIDGVPVTLHQKL